MLRDPDGVAVVITKRVDSNYHSFTFVKVWKDVETGEEKRTHYLNRRHTAAMRRLLSQLEEWLDREVDRNRASRSA